MSSSAFKGQVSLEAAREIANRAATLHERLEGAAATTAQPGFADIRMEIWRRNASAGDEPAFRRRLAWDGLREDQAQGALALGGTCTELPRWARFLTSLELVPRAAGDGPGDAELAAVPFGAFFQPFLEEAARRLRSEASEFLTFVSPEASSALHRHLLSGLSHLATPALFQDFTVARNAETKPTSGGCFRRFIEGALKTAQFEAFFFTYPVLARLLCQHSLAWVETSHELLQRLSRDHDRIASLFAGPGSGLGRIEQLELGLSDRHHGGRQVAVLTFTDGLRLVYKPKDVSLEQAYNNVLRWLQSRAVEDAPPALKVLDGDGYGWVEFAASAPMASLEDVGLYFRKAGALLCLVYALEGSDCHMDNVVATPRGPVLVDAESLLQPRLKPWSANQDASGAFSLASTQLNASVLNTGLLPLWQSGRRGELNDVGGFGGRGGYESSYQQIVWEDLNTDQMRPRKQFKKEPPGHNVARFGGRGQNPADYINELVAGFTNLYRFLLSNQDAFLEDAFVGMKGCTARLIFRPSQHYALLLREARQIRQLRDGIEHSLVFERLCGAFARAAQRPYLWPLCRVEQHELENRDVPFFSVATDGVDLALPGGKVVHGCCERSSWDSSRDLFLQFSPNGMKQQIELIRAAFVPPSETPEPAQAEPPDAINQALQTIRPLSADAFIMAAVAIGKEIAARAIPGKDGVTTWLSPVQWQPDLHGQRGHSYYLYDGTCGIALFLAALCKATGDRRLVPLIEAACRPIAAIAHHPHASSLLAEEGIGGANGLGSIVYALVTMHQLLNAPSFLEIARRAARFISPDRTMADQVLDIHGGSAGAILGLLALHGAAPDPEVLQQAERCGDHLLLKRVPGSQGGMAWRTQPEGTLLAGFAHGAAGIACALARLHQATGREDFLEAAHAAVAYERTIFDSTARNWPVVNPPGTDVPPRFANAWCHGAPGVVLGRLACLTVMDEPNLRAEIDTGLDTTVRGGITTLDHLCCGNMGRIEVALTAGEQLGSERFRNIAAVGATAVVHRASRAGTYTLQARPEQNACFQPGFFRGLSGIGYGLLRLARPQALPCVLNFSTLP